MKISKIKTVALMTAFVSLLIPSSFGAAVLQDIYAHADFSAGGALSDGHTYVLKSGTALTIGALTIASGVTATLESDGATNPLTITALTVAAGGTLKLVGFEQLPTITTLTKTATGNFYIDMSGVNSGLTITNFASGASRAAEVFIRGLTGTAMGPLTLPATTMATSTVSAVTGASCTIGGATTGIPLLAGAGAFSLAATVTAITAAKRAGLTTGATIVSNAGASNTMTF